MNATLRFTLYHHSISTPRFTVPTAPTPANPAQYGTMGIHADLMEGARIACRSMIELLTGEHGLSPTDAYLLCSLAGDPRIFEIVDAGVWNDGMTLTHAVFINRGGPPMRNSTADNRGLMPLFEEYRAFPPSTVSTVPAVNDGAGEAAQTAADAT